MRLEDLVELLKVLKTEEKTGNNDCPFEVGKCYFIRTVTYHQIGKVKEIKGKFIVFEPNSISWVADSGRFMQAINEGDLNEVEPVKVEGGVNMEAISDYFEWIHSLPRDQK